MQVGTLCGIQSITNRQIRGDPQVPGRLPVQEAAKTVQCQQVLKHKAASTWLAFTPHVTMTFALTMWLQGKNVLKKKKIFKPHADVLRNLKL